jgi:hypothetical protein
MSRGKSGCGGILSGGGVIGGLLRRCARECRLRAQQQINSPAISGILFPQMPPDDESSRSESKIT